jgi:hypothetical protein
MEENMDKEQKAIQKIYLCGFERMLEVRKSKGLENRVNWKNGQDVFDWWI